MGHHAHHIPLSVTDPCNVVDRSIDISFRGQLPVPITVAKENLTVVLKALQSLLIDKVVPLTMGDRHFKNIPLFQTGRIGRIAVLNPDKDVLADEAELLVVKHCTRQKARLQKNLETITDAKDRPALFSKLHHLLHYRRETGNCTGSKIVSIREAAGDQKQIHSL